MKIVRDDSRLSSDNATSSLLAHADAGVLTGEERSSARACARVAIRMGFVAKREALFRADVAETHQIFFAVRVVASLADVCGPGVLAARGAVVVVDDAARFVVAAHRVAAHQLARLHGLANGNFDAAGGRFALNVAEEIHAARAGSRAAVLAANAR